MQEACIGPWNDNEYMISLHWCSSRDVQGQIRNMFFLSPHGPISFKVKLNFQRFRRCLSDFRSGKHKVTSKSRFHFDGLPTVAENTICLMYIDKSPVRNACCIDVQWWCLWYTHIYHMDLYIFIIFDNISYVLLCTLDRKWCTRIEYWLFARVQVQNFSH